MASLASNRTTSAERTPLLQKPSASSPTSAPSSSNSPDSSSGTAPPYASKGAFAPYQRLLAATFLLACAFTFTASTLLYQVRVLLCDVWYQTRDEPLHPPGGDRCAVPELEAWTAKEIAFMVVLTTFSGVFNLITTGLVTKRYGVRLAMVFQSAFPILRLGVQSWGILHGGLEGVRALQFSQLITIGGGGAGYMLTSNTFCAELVEPEARTASFGRLQGVQFLGTAIGLLVGGVLGARIHPIAPFLAAVIFLSLSTVVSSFFLPYIPPVVADNAETGKAGRDTSIFAPVKVFLPRRVIKEDGSLAGRWYGLSLLGIGAFVSVFATSFIPMLLQLVGTNRYLFKADVNGYLMALASLSRAGFLSLVFPRIIAAGRRWYSPSSTTSPPPSPPPEPAHIPTTAAEIEPLEPVLQTDQVVQPAPIPPPATETRGSHFDLVFLRLSILLDAVLTAFVPFSSQGWHLFLAAGIIPLASGTAPAAKGVVLEMVEKHEQADALQGIALSETLAMMLTISVSGEVFAKLSELGRGEQVFYVNAANALVAFFILLFVRFPPQRLVAPSAV
ncbi:hypothetical protein JCM8097_002633 [Rhodosporidiobolus ruineniae]